jgi:DegV family protein with EDD domain
VPSIGVVTDSTADFPGDAQARLGITLVPLSVTWDRDSYFDKRDLSTADFYAMLKQRPVLPKTSAPPAGLVEQTYEELLGRVDHIVSVHLAGKLSGTLDVARGAAERVGNGRISVVDSGTTTMCLGWLAIRAAEMAQAGASPEAIVAELEGMKPRLRLYAVLDTLDFVQRGGRIGRAQALLGSLLNFKPLITVRDGEVHPVERPRSRQAAMRRLADVVAGQGRVERVAVLQGGMPEVLDELARVFGERLPNVALDRGEIGIVLGTHAGPVFGATALLAS